MHRICIKIATPNIQINVLFFNSSPKTFMSVEFSFLALIRLNICIKTKVLKIIQIRLLLSALDYAKAHVGEISKIYSPKMRLYLPLRRIIPRTIV